MEQRETARSGRGTGVFTSGGILVFVGCIGLFGSRSQARVLNWAGRWSKITRQHGHGRANYVVEIPSAIRSTMKVVKVVGKMRFHVAGRDSLHNGTAQDFYEMKGQYDLTGDALKAVEVASFGSVKALFR